MATKPMKHAFQVREFLMSLMHEEPLEASCDPVFVFCRCCSKAILSRSSYFRSTKLPALILSTTLARIGGSTNDGISGKALTAAAGGGSGTDGTTKLYRSNSNGRLCGRPALPAPGADVKAENRGTDANAWHGGMTPGCEDVAEVGSLCGRPMPPAKRAAAPA